MSSSEAELPVAGCINREDADGDVPQLSMHALAALQEFYTEQQQSLLDTFEGTATVSEDWVTDMESDKLYIE